MAVHGKGLSPSQSGSTTYGKGLFPSQSGSTTYGKELFADLKPEWQRHIVATPEERRQHHLRQQVRLRGPRATRLAEAKARDYSLARVAPASCACDVPVSPCRAAEKCQQGDSNDSTRDVHDVAMLVTKATPTPTRDVELFVTQGRL